MSELFFRFALVIHSNYCPLMVRRVTAFHVGTELTCLHLLGPVSYENRQQVVSVLVMLLVCSEPLLVSVLCQQPEHSRVLTKVHHVTNM